MANLVQIGNKEVGWAPIEDGTIGTPKVWPGIGSTEQESEQESEAIYKDDVVYYNAEGGESYKLKLKVAQIPPEFAIACLGYVETAEGALVQVGDIKPCVLYIKTTVLNGETGSKTEKLDYFYNSTPASPKIETNTDEDKVKENELELEFLCTKSPLVQSVSGKNVAHSFITRSTSNSAFFDTYKTKILVPKKPTTATLSTGGDK